MISTASIILKAVFLALVTSVVTFVGGEGMSQIKNSDQKNYTTEMWRYTRELKRVPEYPGRRLTWDWDVAITRAP